MTAASIARDMEAIAADLAKLSAAVRAAKQSPSRIVLAFDPVSVGASRARLILHPWRLEWKTWTNRHTGEKIGVLGLPLGLSVAVTLRRARP